MDSELLIPVKKESFVGCESTSFAYIPEHIQHLLCQAGVSFHDLLLIDSMMKRMSYQHCIEKVNRWIRNPAVIRKGFVCDELVIPEAKLPFGSRNGICGELSLRFIALLLATGCESRLRLHGIEAIIRSGTVPTFFNTASSMHVWVEFFSSMFQPVVLDPSFKVIGYREDVGYETKDFKGLRIQSDMMYTSSLVFFICSIDEFQQIVSYYSLQNSSVWQSKIDYPFHFIGMSADFDGFSQGAGYNLGFYKDQLGQIKPFIFVTFAHSSVQGYAIVALRADNAVEIVVENRFLTDDQKNEAGNILRSLLQLKIVQNNAQGYVLTNRKKLPAIMTKNI